MSISVVCPGCDKKYRVKDEMAGKRIKCRACGQIVPIPGASASGTVSSILAPKQEIASSESKPRKSSLFYLVGLISAVSLGLVVGIVLLLNRPGKTSAPNTIDNTQSPSVVQGEPATDVGETFSPSIGQHSISVVQSETPTDVAETGKMGFTDAAVTTESRADATSVADSQPRDSSEEGAGSQQVEEPALGMPSSSVQVEAMTKLILDDRDVVPEDAIRVIKYYLQATDSQTTDIGVIGQGTMATFSVASEGGKNSLIVTGADDSSAKLSLSEFRAKYGEPIQVEEKEISQSVQVREVSPVSNYFAPNPTMITNVYTMKYLYEIYWYGPIGLGQEKKIEKDPFFPFGVNIRTTPYETIGMVLIKAEGFHAVRDLALPPSQEPPSSINIERAREMINEFSHASSGDQSQPDK